MTPKIITREERQARAGNSAPNVTATPVNQVGWRKKGCATCKPIVVQTKPI